MREMIRECYQKLHGEVDLAGLEKFCEILIGQMWKDRNILFHMESWIANLKFGSRAQFQKATNGDESRLFESLDEICVWWEGDQFLRWWELL